MKKLIALAAMATSIAVTVPGNAVADCMPKTHYAFATKPSSPEEQLLMRYHVVDGWSHSITTKPSWMTGRRGRRDKWDVIDLWGVARPGTYMITLRYDRAGENSVFCTEFLRIR